MILSGSLILHFIDSIGFLLFWTDSSVFNTSSFVFTSNIAHSYCIKLIKKKDYISHPKPNGYRSLHLILEVPIFLTNEKKMMRVEVQFRTIAMDFWASLEHKLKYKKDIDNAQVISQDLCFCAELISQLDGRMQQIRERLEEKKDDTQSNITGV